MKHLFQVILLAASLSMLLDTAHAALIEHNLVVEPNFKHHNDRNSVSITSSHMELMLPAMTLSPGDLLRVTFELSGGKYLKIGPTPFEGFQDFGATLILNSELSADTSINDPNVTETTRIYDANSQLLVEQSEPGRYPVNLSQQKISYLDVYFYREIHPGEPTDLTFDKWVIELQIPTTINTPGGSFPNQPTTYLSNILGIGFNLYVNNYRDMPDVAVYIVPEPGTLLLAGMTVLVTLLCGRNSAVATLRS